ncbi:hypothetical protein NJC38_14210 [Pseudomonas sp. 21LCFQ010]|uniref:hypothetical protein n=1 Tax=Pseudomonas sp. 21LCFQ010 TaxID=2957506 RepID=UPI0020981BF7|nr:hypothetical protein [Pseudomonas sp. 21LCFQ010]MCO8163314.1 hypothetical protein [Pseudomonas sp. 21LCFQ010]
MTPNPNALSAALANLSSKISLPDFTVQLRTLGLPVSNSWTKTLANLQAIIDSPNAQPKDLASLATLVTWVGTYLKNVSKAIAVFEAGQCPMSQFLTLADGFIKGLTNAGVSSNHPAGDYPALSSKDQCGKIVEQFYFRHIEKLSSQVLITTSTVSEYMVREKINVTKADSAAVGKLSGYSEIFGVRKAAYEHVDVIRICHGVTGSDQVSVDLILDVSRPGAAVLNQDEISRRLKKYDALISAALKSALPSFQSSPSLNFFSAMDKIYNSKDGNVCELGFVTAIGGSVKKEKMKRNTADLRIETWHAGGRNAIATAKIPDTIDIYRLSVSWKIVMSADQPILSIPGSYKSLSTGDVRHALILGCTEKASFDFAYERLLAYSI